MNQRLDDLANETDVLAVTVESVVRHWEEMTASGLLHDLYIIQSHVEYILEDVRLIRDRVYVDHLLSDDE